MEDDVKKTMKRLEKVFDNLSDCLDGDLKTTGLSGLSGILDCLSKTVDLLNKLAKCLH